MLGMMTVQGSISAAVPIANDGRPSRRQPPFLSAELIGHGELT